MTDALFSRIALIGIGLIGSSIAINLRDRNLASHIAISTRSPATLARADALVVRAPGAPAAGANTEVEFVELSFLGV